MESSVPQATVAKWSALADRLISLTRKNKLNWRETSNENMFVTAIGNAVVSILHKDIARDGERVPIIEIAIQDASGRTIDSFDDEDIEKLGPKYTELKDMLSSINRKLTGADDVLDSILRELQENDDFDF